MLKHADAAIGTSTTVCFSQIRRSEVEDASRRKRLPAVAHLARNAATTRNYSHTGRCTSVRSGGGGGGVDTDADESDNADESDEDKQRWPSTRESASCVASADAMCFSDAARIFDMAVAIVFSLAAVFCMASAPFDTRSGAAQIRAFFLLASLLPLGAVALFNATTARHYETARFGFLYGVVIAVATAAVAGAAFGSTGAHHLGSPAAAVQAMLFVVFGSYAGYRCHHLRRRCVTRAGSLTLAVVAPPAGIAVLETRVYPAVVAVPTTDKERARLLYERGKFSAIVTDSFRHALAWTQAAALIIVAMDIDNNGGPVARPALTCAVASAGMLPIIQEIILALLARASTSHDCEMPRRRHRPHGHDLGSGTRVLCAAYVCAALASVVAYLAAGFFLPLMRFGHGTKEPRWWMDQVCDLSAPDSDCVALAVRTYLAILGSVAVSLYSSYVYAAIATAESASRTTSLSFGTRLRHWCGTACGVSATFSEDSE